MLTTHRVPTHPGEVLLEEFLRPLGVTQVALAQHLGVPVQRINELEVALLDRDPAMQFAGVQSLRQASGEDLGNDVQAWRQYVASLTPAGERSVSIAESPQSTSTY